MGRECVIEDVDDGDRGGVIIPVFRKKFELTGKSTAKVF